MSQVHTGTPPDANVPPPHLYDISSLSILPIELRDIVFDFMAAIPCPSNTYTIVRLSKKHFHEFIHLLYKHIRVSDEAILRGLFNGLLDDGVDHTKGSLYHKRDLLGRCSSMLIASLYAWEAVKEAIQAWAMAVKNRPQETEGSVQQKLDGEGSKIGGNYQPHASFCIVGLSRKPLHPEAAPRTDDKLNTIVVPPGMGIKMMSDNVVTRFLPPADCIYPQSVGAGLEVLVGRDLLVVELLPVKMEETANEEKEGSVIHRPSGGHRNEDAVKVHIDYIVRYCVSTISGWNTENQE
ncbi:hypothetical protein L202_03174 [Cryptococcus amylolentus CBS 6039]|uniref:Uncharacterized protein n=1 Tax=Cryptococcus amylolentus CBS 6039 TaxID=1295533 RepID=A0A1E3HXQ4_9TREE|nr:hypothetical protein L202_03174 [Cryptococcus amylolentus CBS 6039]ODN81079.1 hypothetical protein L202_03174 [Cryptococcus amylolentus CBS 6039]